MAWPDADDLIAMCCALEAVAAAAAFQNSLLRLVMQQFTWLERILGPMVKFNSCE